MSGYHKAQIYQRIPKGLSSMGIRIRFFFGTNFLIGLAIGVTIRSFQLDTTSSQETSVRIRYKIGILGLLETNMNPRCLKETISPGCGFHLFANSVVPAGATNLSPFGL